MPLRLPESVSNDASLLIRHHTDINSEWLIALLKAPATFTSVSSVGTGQVASTFRIKFETSQGTESLVIKIAADDAGSRAFGVDYGAYAKEVNFYAHLGAKVAATGVVPICWLAVLDQEEGFFSLVLEDIKDGVQGDQMVGLSVKEAAWALESLAALHAPFINSHELAHAPWLVEEERTMDRQQLYNKLLPGFIERYGDKLDPEHLELINWFGDHVAAHENEPLGKLDCFRHQDYRPDNLLFTPTRCIAVDFQGTGFGLLMHDAAFFIGGSLLVETRRQHELELLKGYIASLQSKTDVKLEWDTVWWQYRRQTMTPVWVAVIAGMLCVQTPRGDEMFITMASRAAQHAIDLGIEELFPPTAETVA